MPDPENVDESTTEYFLKMYDLSHKSIHELINELKNDNELFSINNSITNTPSETNEFKSESENNDVHNHQPQSNETSNSIQDDDENNDYTSDSENENENDYTSESDSDSETKKPIQCPHIFLQTRTHLETLQLKIRAYLNSCETDTERYTDDNETLISFQYELGSSMNNCKKLHEQFQQEFDDKYINHRCTENHSLEECIGLLRSNKTMKTQLQQNQISFIIGSVLKIYNEHAPLIEKYIDTDHSKQINIISPAVDSLSKLFQPYCRSELQTHTQRETLSEQISKSANKRKYSIRQEQTNILKKIKPADQTTKSNSKKKDQTIIKKKQFIHTREKHPDL
jgi:hypothetical protein